MSECYCCRYAPSRLERVTTLFHLDVQETVLLYDWATRLSYIHYGHFILFLNPYCVICLFIRLRAERSGVQFPALTREFYCLWNVQMVFWGPSKLLINHYRGTFTLGLKRLGSQAYTSPPSFVEVIVSSLMSSWRWKEHPIGLSFTVSTSAVTGCPCGCRHTVW
jgi:hypothetical protein